MEIQMKKIIAIFALALTLSANAFWNNNGPWGNNYNGYGYADDNGIFAYNPYDYWDPRWYFEEMENMMDEFDDEFGGNDYYGPYGYNNPYNNFRNGPWGPAPVAPTAPVAPAPVK